MSEESRKFLDFGVERLRLSEKRVSGKSDTEKLERQIKAMNAEYMAKKREWAKKRMIDAISEWNIYFMDEHIRIEEELEAEFKKELDAYAACHPEWTPGSPYPPQLEENLRAQMKLISKEQVVNWAIFALMEEGKNWEIVAKKFGHLESINENEPPVTWN